MSQTPDAETLGLHLSLITTALSEIVSALEEQTDVLQAVGDAVRELTVVSAAANGFQEYSG